MEDEVQRAFDEICEALLEEEVSKYRQQLYTESDCSIVNEAMLRGFKKGFRKMFEETFQSEFEEAIRRRSNHD